MLEVTIKDQGTLAESICYEQPATGKVPTRRLAAQGSDQDKAIMEPRIVSEGAKSYSGISPPA